jgi:mono/diheme cytochrome c family protein
MTAAALRRVLVMMRCVLVGLSLLMVLSRGAGAETAAQRGKKALLTKAYNPPTMLLGAYESAWKHWGLKEKPDAQSFDRLYRERYGLHPAPYPNDGLPMGLRKGDTLLGKGKGVTTDCMLCHGGSIFGQSYVGLGNTSLDFQLFYEEMNAAAPRRAKPPFTFTRVRGTVEAGGMSVFLLGFREPDLSLRLLRRDLDLRDDLCEDTPAWWLLKKKKTMYYTGGADTRSVRSLMQFMMSPLNFPPAFHKAEADFKDIRAYLLSLEAPKYPLAIDHKLAAKGQAIFEATCSRCHGTYGEKWTYPNKVVPLEQIGTDRRRYDGVTKKFGAYYNTSWFAGDYKAIASDGYQAPPLDGIWATAPYLHNGSVPTLYHVLNSKSRPAIFTRSYRTDREAYDERNVGWKVTVLKEAPDPTKVKPHEARRVYDTSQPGRGNGGHTYGDKLSEQERQAVIEYLKTL